MSKFKKGDLWLYEPNKYARELKGRDNSSVPPVVGECVVVMRVATRVVEFPASKHEIEFVEVMDLQGSIKEVEANTLKKRL